jgi:hypothetical protein
MALPMPLKALQKKQPATKPLSTLSMMTKAGPRDGAGLFAFHANLKGSAPC